MAGIKACNHDIKACDVNCDVRGILGFFQTPPIPPFFAAFSFLQTGIFPM